MVQKDEFAQSGDDGSPDRQERIQDFLARHGGPGSRPNREEELDPGIRGWSEIYAADGFKLRCDWSCFGSRKEMKFAEIPPRGQDAASGADAADGGGDSTGGSNPTGAQLR